jgi:hypothetical protein
MVSITPTHRLSACSQKPSWVRSESSLCPNTPTSGLLGMYVNASPRFALPYGPNTCRLGHGRAKVTQYRRLARLPADAADMILDYPGLLHKLLNTIQ